MSVDDIAGETHKAKQRSAAASRATDNRGIRHMRVKSTQKAPAAKSRSKVARSIP